jgi:hypothetical protein
MEADVARMALDLCRQIQVAAMRDLRGLAVIHPKRFSGGADVINPKRYFGDVLASMRRIQGWAGVRIHPKPVAGFLRRLAADRIAVRMR